MLEVQVLGHLNLRLNGAAWMQRVNALRMLFLTYLSHAERPCPREELAILFWPQVEIETARTNLRALVHRLRQEGLEGYFVASRHAIGFAPEAPVICDFVTLSTLLTRLEQADMSTLLQADALYGGPLFAGVNLDEYPQLAGWVAAHQRELEVRLVHLYQRLIPALLAQGHTQQAVRAGARLVELAPYDDGSRLHYIQALTAAGNLADALAELNGYRRTMVVESGASQLSPELEALATQLSHPDQATRLFPAPPALASAAVEPLTLPVPPRDLIGRTSEAERLTFLLDRGSRLISITGLGGIGKTAFVLSQLPTLRTRFHGQVYVLDLRSVERPGSTSVEQAAERAIEALLQAAAAALEMDIQNGVSLLEQVHAALTAAPICLILDNFETVHDAARAVAYLVERTPTLTVITTSRQALYTKDEATLEMGGLQVQKRGAGEERRADMADTDWSEGAWLFLQRAGVDTSEISRIEVEALCAHLGGHPLAIELAAAQLDFYGLDELLETTVTDIAALVAGQGDPLGDHDNLERMLDRMWAPLSAEARGVLARLSLFAGKFHRKAMQAVAPASLEVYRELRNASLLQRAGEAAWFSLHPLVKQNAAQHLDDDDPARIRYTTYFLTLPEFAAHQRAPSVQTELALIRSARRVHTDLVHAWQWAVDHGEWELLADALSPMHKYLAQIFQRNEAIRLFEAAHAQLASMAVPSPATMRLAGRVASMLGSHYLYLDFDTCVTWRLQAIAWLEDDGSPRELAQTYISHGDFMLVNGARWQEAEQPLRNAAALIETYALDDLRPLYMLAEGDLLRYQGKWAALRALNRELVEILPSTLGEGLWSGVLSYSAHLGAWAELVDHIEQLETSIEREDSAFQIEPWIAYYRAQYLYQQGERPDALAMHLSQLSTYAARVPVLMPLVHGELALWHQQNGDSVAASAASAQALKAADAQLDAFIAGLGTLMVAAGQLLRGDTAASNALSSRVLGAGREWHILNLLFGGIFLQTLLHKDRLPRDLFEHVLKIAAVSPALQPGLRPLAREQLDAQGLALSDAERKTLWATDLAAVEALDAEVKKAIGAWEKERLRG